MAPSVTAVIPTYNRAHYIRDAVDSVLNQTVPVDEIIVVDDGSQDDTAAVLSTIRGPVRYIRQENAGAAAARNRGMAEAEGEFIAFLDSDDLWVPHKNEWQLRFLSEHAGVDFVFGDMCNFTDPTDATLEPEIKHPRIHDYYVRHASNLEQMAETLVVDNLIPTPTVMIRRECALRIGSFDTSLPICEDLDYWLRATRLCRFGFVNKVLMRRRRHDGNLINSWIRREELHVEALLRAARSEPPHPRRLRRQIRQRVDRLNYEIGSLLLRHNRVENAWHRLSDGFPRTAIHPKRLAKLCLCVARRMNVKRREVMGKPDAA